MDEYDNDRDDDDDESEHNNDTHLSTMKYFKFIDHPINYRTIDEKPRDVCVCVCVCVLLCRFMWSTPKL